MVKTYVQTICLREACVVGYIEYHKDSWPPVVKSLAAVGILDLKIYFRCSHGGSHARLVMFMTTTDEFDLKVDFAKHALSSPIVAEWEKRMKEFQKPAPEALGDEWWASMAEVFDLNSQLATADEREGYKCAEAVSSIAAQGIV